MLMLMLLICHMCRRESAEPLLLLFILILLSAGFFSLCVMTTVITPRLTALALYRKPSLIH